MSEFALITLLIVMAVALFVGFIILIVLVGHILGPFLGSKKLDSDDPEERLMAYVRLAIAGLVVVGLFQGFNSLLGHLGR